MAILIHKPGRKQLLRPDVMTCNIISARLTSRSFPAVSDYSKSKLWKIVRMAEDWRDGSSCMQHLIAKLHLRQTQGAVLTLFSFL